MKRQRQYYPMTQNWVSLKVFVEPKWCQTDNNKKLHFEIGHAFIDVAWRTSHQVPETVTLATGQAYVHKMFAAAN
jgi:hypothetical protein